MTARYRTLLLLSALLAAFALARAAGLPGASDLLIAPVVLVTLAVFLTPLAVPAYIRLHGLPWRRMM